MATVHLLRPDSITPIQIYLDLRARQPDAAATHIDYASVLLYREREYLAMFSSRWMMGDATPSPSPSSPFAPFDLTERAAAALRSNLGGHASGDARTAPDDLFGLKADAAAGLTTTLAPTRADRFGWLLLAQMRIDLTEYGAAIAAAEQAAIAGEAPTAHALVHHAALAGRAQLPRADAIAESAAKRARALVGARLPARWVDERRRAFDERLRKHALGVRTRVEGDAFTRFLKTPAQFCADERDASMANFRDDRVPADLQPLIPLARALGVGDDVCRAHFVGKLSRQARHDARTRIHGAGDAIDRWLDSIGPPPYEHEAAAFFWLRHALDEM
ncbi:MAG TPA: hypothetical protein VFO19_05860 [Vicinamibacterales bacterium]|nr:hypothetical protein [Vicinamibacterales bacterium]